VIAGYRPEELAVVDEERPDWKAVVQVNTGIVVSYNIGHATEAIDAYLGADPGSVSGSDHADQP
jgi:hypothetical protein